MANEERGSPVSSGSSESSPAGSSESSVNRDITVRQWYDNQAMSLWRITVDPLHNIGEPISAEWEYPCDIPNTPDQNRSSIRQAVDRHMVIEYRGGGWGYWTPGEAVEFVHYNPFPENSGQSWHRQIPDASQPMEVYHSTSIPPGYNSQYTPPIYYTPDNASELIVEYVNDITRVLYRKGFRYIRNFVNRYFVTPPVSDEFTADIDKTARKMIGDIFIEANSADVDYYHFEAFVEDQWDRHIRTDDIFGFVLFDSSLYEDDRDVKIYNKKGKSLRPANKAELRSGVAAGSQYIPRFNPSPTNIRNRTQKRNKKLIKEHRALLESIKDNPNLMYGDDETDRLHNDKMNKLHQELRQKVRSKKVNMNKLHQELRQKVNDRTKRLNDDRDDKSARQGEFYGNFGGRRATRRRKYKRTTRKFRGKSK